MLYLLPQLLCRRYAHRLILTSVFFGATACLPAKPTSPTLITKIEQRLNTYRTSYPEIEFIQLRSMTDLQAIVPLTQHLGPQARNLDYAHPADVRELLIETQQGRITQLLDNRQPSATIFEVGTASKWGKPFLCLLTYDESIFLGDKTAATRFMTDLKEADIQGLPVEQLLDNTQFALYTLDHEVFHCLDGYHNGPLYPMTMSDIKSLYDQNIVEIRAEIFAGFAHLMRYPNHRSLLHNLAQVRALSLASWDPIHYTAPILKRLAKLPSNTIPNADLVELVKITTKQAQAWSPGLDSYKKFLITAYHLAINIGVPMDDVAPEIQSFSLIRPDEQAYINLLGELNLAQGWSKQTTLPTP